MAYLQFVGRPVFIAPPWREIYRQDRERKQDYEEAICSYDAPVATYTVCGYELIELPCFAVEERVQFVLNGASVAAALPDVPLPE